MTPASSARPSIGLDGFNLALDEGTGVATYARNLTRALKGRAEVNVLYGQPIGRARDALAREVAFFDPPRRGLPKWLRTIDDGARVARAVAARGVSADLLDISGRVEASDFAQRMPHFDRLWNVDRLFTTAADYFDVFRRPLTVRMPTPPKVMHWTYPLPLRVEGARNIYTLHDLVPLRLPHTTLDRKPSYLRLVRWIARHADHIVTVSESSRRDIVQLLEVDADRVTNTYQSVELGADRKALDLRDLPAQLSGAFGLSYQGYFLFFGAIEPKKNIDRLLHAFLSASVEAPLVLVGKRAWKSEQQLRMLSLVGGGGVLSAEGRVRRLDYVPADMLIALVRGARAVLFPSLYEGFGLPVAEAMSLGAPVITSNTSALPEVAGDAALLVDPYDPADIVRAIREIDGDASLRAELARRGQVQAGRFSKESYTVRLGELYARLGAPLGES